MRRGRERRDRREREAAARQTDIVPWKGWGTVRDAGLRDFHLKCSWNFTTFSPQAWTGRER